MKCLAYKLGCVRSVVRALKAQWALVKLMRVSRSIIQGWGGGEGNPRNNEWYLLAFFFGSSNILSCKCFLSNVPGGAALTCNYA